MKWDGEGPDDYSLCYSSPITSDVIGWLDPEQVEMYAQAVHDLRPGEVRTDDDEEAT